MLYQHFSFFKVSFKEGKCLFYLYLMVQLG
jgi:hypothetical protein